MPLIVSISFVRIPRGLFICLPIPSLPLQEAEKEEERLKAEKAAKKAAFNAAYDEGDIRGEAGGEDGAGGEEEAVEGKRRRPGPAGDDEETFYDAKKRELCARVAKTRVRIV